MSAHRDFARVFSKRQVIMKAFVARIAVLVLVVLGCSLVVSAQGITPQEVDAARIKIVRAIMTHPEPLVREKLMNWIATERVQFAANKILPEMSSSLEKNDYGKRIVLLWYNVDYVLKMPDVNNPPDKELLLWLVLYHEAVHIDDHFSGRILLEPLISVGPVSDEYITRKMWDAEWSAVNKEWVLAKKMGKPYLVPMIAMAVRNGESPRSFLDGFYQLQMAGGPLKLNPGLAKFFTARYKQELAKLSVK